MCAEYLSDIPPQTIGPTSLHIQLRSSVSQAHELIGMRCDCTVQVPNAWPGDRFRLPRRRVASGQYSRPLGVRQLATVD